MPWIVRLPSCLGHSAKGLWTLRAQVGVLLIIVHTHCKKKMSKCRDTVMNLVSQLDLVGARQRRRRRLKRRVYCCKVNTSAVYKLLFYWGPVWFSNYVFNL